MREAVEAEIAPLELPFPQVTPFGEGNRLAVVGPHGEGVAVHEVERQHGERGAVKVIGRREVQVRGEALQEVGAALGDVVRQQFDAVHAHQAEQGVVPALKFRRAVLPVHGGEFPP